MINPKGGRGNVAPYITVTARVPEDIKPQIDAIVATYKELKLLKKEVELQEFINRIETAIVFTAHNSETKLPTLEEATEIANKLLKQKQSKQATIEKFLKLLYNRE